MFEVESADEIMAPLWQISPAAAPPINVNLLSDERVATLYGAMMATRHSILSPAYQIEELFDFAFDPEEKYLKVEPHAFLLEPVFATYAADSDIVALLIGLTSYKNLFTRLLPDDKHGIIAVVTDTCGLDITYELNGVHAKFLGYEDLHDPDWEDHVRTTSLEAYPLEVEGICQHFLSLYPSNEYRSLFDTNRPLVFTLITVAAFVATLLLMIAYDVTVNRRQEKTMKIALRSNAVVSSLFPQAVRDRIMEDAMDQQNSKGNGNGKTKNESNEDDNLEDRPIADFYPNVSVCFADISGFTAWSSTREPFQVFTLLETLFSHFDSIAKRCVGWVCL